ncbi:hypothetical protein [Mesorhizobium sp. CN2-181]|uniref:hypothetical protein n=1 Tax=Mesorhizobium yinganensis TaxID=3157707 RepID=UPI0032B797B1
MLIKIAEIAQEDADVRLAQTDPSRFILLRNGVTSWHLKGLTGVTPDSIRKALEKHRIAYLDPTDRTARPTVRAGRTTARARPAM